MFNLSKLPRGFSGMPDAAFQAQSSFVDFCALLRQAGEKLKPLGINAVIADDPLKGVHLISPFGRIDVDLGYTQLSDGSLVGCARFFEKVEQGAHVEIVPLYGIAFDPQGWKDKAGKGLPRDHHGAPNDATVIHLIYGVVEAQVTELIGRSAKFFDGAAQSPARVGLFI